MNKLFLLPFFLLLTGCLTHKEEQPGKFQIAGKEKLKALPANTVKEINLCRNHEQIGKKGFVFPINFENIHLLFEKFKLDTSSLRAINNANLITVEAGCEGIRDKDSLAFREDFNFEETQANLFHICMCSPLQNPGMESEGFFIVSPDKSGRYYLITYQRDHQREESIRIIDAALIHYRLFGNAYVGYSRAAIFFDESRIEINEECYEHQETVISNKVNLSVNQDGKIQLTGLSVKN